MGISKVWLEEQIENAKDVNAKWAFRLCYNELVKSPVKTPKQAKPINHDKVYDSTFQFYLKKGYTPDEAHKIAVKIIQQQQEKASYNFEEAENE